MIKPAIHEYKVTQGRVKTILFDTGSDMARHALETATYRGEGFSGSGWSDISGKQACVNARDGNLEAAAASDRLVTQFEAFAPPRMAWESIDNTVGAVPVVPNYIAGNPMNMRLRRRTSKETAPLAIIVDATSSGGINSADVNNRGSAILAFARAISARRPVELWVFAGLGSAGGGAVFVGNRIETAPMDLAHAAPCLASVAWSRNVGYQICKAHGSNGAWPFNRRALTSAQTEAVLSPALPHLSETLVIPGIMLHDELTTKPVQWIQRTLAKYSGMED